MNTQVMSIDMEPDFAGARKLALVKFLLYTDNPNQVPYMAVYEYFHVENTSSPESFVLTLLSTTRIDTNETVEVSSQARMEIRGQVCEAIVLHLRDSWDVH